MKNIQKYGKKLCAVSKHLEVAKVLEDFYCPNINCQHSMLMKGDCYFFDKQFERIDLIDFQNYEKEFLNLSD